MCAQRGFLVGVGLAEAAGLNFGEPRPATDELPRFRRVCKARPSAGFCFFWAIGLQKRCYSRAAETLASRVPSFLIVRGLLANPPGLNRRARVNRVARSINSLARRSKNSRGNCDYVLGTAQSKNFFRAPGGFRRTFFHRSKVS
jgi:hypothetical protein